MKILIVLSSTAQVPASDRKTGTPGGLGPVFDLTNDPTSIALIEAMRRANKPVAAVCHGLAALRLAHTPDGSPVVQGRAVAGFSDSAVPA